MQQDFNRLLADIRRDGTYQKIYDRWRNADDPSALPPPRQHGTGRTVRITHSEQSLVTSLDFMVEQMTSTPLGEMQRSELSEQCRQVVEEPTKRGFRVKLII